MRVLVDSSTLIALANIGELDIINVIFGKVYITTKIREEILKPDYPETEVLKDCADKLVNVKYLFCEYHSHAAEKQSFDEILKVLSEAGFRYHIKEAYTSRFPFIERPLMLGMDLQLDVFAFRI